MRGGRTGLSLHCYTLASPSPLPPPPSSVLGETRLEDKTVLVFLNNLWGLGTELEQGCRTGPPGYKGRRNRFLGIDSWASNKFKNTTSMVTPSYLSLTSWTFPRIFTVSRKFQKILAEHLRNFPRKLRTFSMKTFIPLHKFNHNLHLLGNFRETLSHSAWTLSRFL